MSKLSEAERLDYENELKGTEESLNYFKEKILSGKETSSKDQNTAGYIEKTEELLKSFNNLLDKLKSRG